MATSLRQSFERQIGDLQQEVLRMGTYAVDITGIPIRGRFLDIEPPRRLVFTWGVAGNDAFPAGSSTVEITLTPDRDATVLELVHSGLPADEVPKHGTGWTHFLGRLGVLAAGGDPGPDTWTGPDAE